MNTTSHRVYQTGEGERGSEVAANDLGRLRIRLAVSLFNCSLMPPNEKQIRQRDMLLLLTSWEMLVENFLGHEIYSSHFGCAHSFWWAIACARIS